ncbi:glycosyltransferase family 4 protein [Metabacillus niabensis]|uniref:glycosyltransferase family 4 protein n=1 Tax=Metabacillus niabensis TaxID=324854 RepID=UPI001CF9D5D4|nr:glycosyltransferase family 4 protein [Metabacillus niabensis]
MKKNLLFLHSSSELYGSDRSLLNIVKNINGNNYGITIILPEEGPLVNELKKIKSVDVQIKDIATLRRKDLSVMGLIKYTCKFVGSLIFLIKVILKKKIHVVYTNTSVVFPGGIAAKLMGRKSIWHIREIINNNIERKTVSSIVKVFADIIIANSKATALAISTSSKKIRVVYNAIESTNNRIINKAENQGDIVIGMAGRINRWKGQKLFVDMAEKVLIKNETARFVIAGDVYKGESHIKDDLKEYIKNKGLESKVTLLGQVEDMNDFYNNIDIFVLPSIQPEPFGLVVLEAMEREIPVVATNHGGPTEIIENKIDGFLVNHIDASEMSERVLELVSNKELRKSIGQKGKEKRSSIFNIDNYVKNITCIIDNI